MITIHEWDTKGFEAAVIGMRNPYNSHDKSDSAFYTQITRFGPADMRLMETLAKAGTEHRKYLRMIAVWADICAPLYWWKEFDTYKIGTVANSESTMHTIMKHEFTLDMFSHEHLNAAGINSLQRTIDDLNACRTGYLMTDEAEWKKEIWWQVIQLLPESFNQNRTVMMNYEVLMNIYRQRKNHKLDEWREFCRWIEGLPLGDILTIADAKKTGTDMEGGET